MMSISLLPLPHSLLPSAGAHPSIRDNQCWLPLHYAVWNGHVECVEAILNCPTPKLGLVGLQAAIGLAENSRNDRILAILREAFEKRQKTIVQPLLFDTAMRGSKDRLMEVLESGDNVNPVVRCHVTGHVIQWMRLHYMVHH